MSDPIESAITSEHSRQEAASETARLQRDLDITNADHIALWLEANTIPEEPMSQCISWLACRIVEAHEAARKQTPSSQCPVCDMAFPSHAFNCSLNLP